jgi:predicted component of type VI protein secretion system
MDVKLRLTVMSGVEDGQSFECASSQGDGKLASDAWTISIGRLDECDIRLSNDTYVSREHAFLHWRNDHWWLEDCQSRNGTFVINETDFFQDRPVRGIVHLETGCLFRVGRTWLRIESDN